MPLRSINPLTGEIIAEYSVHTPAEAAAAVSRADVAQQAWAEVTLEQRLARLSALARLFRERKEALAGLAAREMGKLKREGMDEVEKCASACEYYVKTAPQGLADRQVETEWVKSYVSHRPLGVLLAIMPWNFPFWQVVRAAAPAMAVGNALVLKHASNVTGCALALEEIFRDAGFPDGLFGVVKLPGKDIGKLIPMPEIAAVTLTGSTPAGREVAKIAGEHLKKTVLELGGSDGYVILEDADIALTADACTAGRLLNCGQSCIASKRLIVVDAAREAFTQALLDRFRTRVTGNPLDAATTLAPMARTDLRDELHRQVEESVRKGAKLLLGVEVPGGKGAFYPATILTDVKPGMPAFDEELFGPVGVIISARDEEEAIALANQSSFGLGAAVFTRDLARGERIARERLQAGSCFVNGNVRSDPRMPFGGIKESGYGRELSLHGLHEFVNIKTVMVK